MIEEKKEPKAARHKILTLYYDDEGDGAGVIYLETPQGIAQVSSVGANGDYQFDWTQMLRTEATDLVVRSHFLATVRPREAIVVIAEETLKASSEETP